MCLLDRVVNHAGVGGGSARLPDHRVGVGSLGRLEVESVDGLGDILPQRV